MKLILILLMLFNCIDSPDKYYPVIDANTRIALAFGVKDQSCNYSHPIKSILPGKAEKRQVNVCVQAIMIKTCDEWRVVDPTPAICRTIRFQFKLKR